jgi:hypothetical protein
MIFTVSASRQIDAGQSITDGTEGKKSTILGKRMLGPPREIQSRIKLPEVKAA